MKNDILTEALRRRRGKNFDTKRFNEPSPGLDSDDLKEKTSLTLGNGVNDESLKGHRSGQIASSDDLAPSNQELENKGMKVATEIKSKKLSRTAEETLGFKPFKSDITSAEVGGGHDDDVFDEREYEKLKKKKPSSIYERMQLKLGNKLKGE